jgi:hypothetical protein
MAFNAEDNWEFPAAVVVASEGAVEIGLIHVAPAKANPGAILQAAVFKREIRALPHPHPTSAPTVGRDIYLPENPTSSGRRTFNVI